jgi:hypothetical protein
MLSSVGSVPPMSVSGSSLWVCFWPLEPLKKGGGGVSDSSQTQMAFLGLAGSSLKKSQGGVIVSSRMHTGELLTNNGGGVIDSTHMQTGMAGLDCPGMYHRACGQ